MVQSLCLGAESIPAYNRTKKKEHIVLHRPDLIITEALCGIEPYINFIAWRPDYTNIIKFPINDGYVTCQSHVLEVCNFLKFPSTSATDRKQQKRFRDAKTCYPCSSLFKTSRLCFLYCDRVSKTI